MAKNPAFWLKKCLDSIQKCNFELKILKLLENHVKTKVGKKFSLSLSLFFFFFLNKALSWKNLTKKCQKGDYLAKVDFFWHFLVKIFKNKVLIKKKKKKKKEKRERERKLLLNFCLNVIFK